MMLPSTLRWVWILLSIQYSVAVISFNVRLRIPQGELVGETGLTTDKRVFYKFWCIPYGTAERFEASVPAEPWGGTLDATYCDRRCTQTNMASSGDGDSMFAYGTATKDCLILNVFAPADIDPKKGLVPVMFWIHGGYYHLGSGLDYSGEMLLNEDIILVTINYRLGAFGFLTTGDGVIEGNLGMKDMVLALEWVQKNIKYFKGDPNRVTIFGESAGAGAVSTLTLSPMSKGLFHRVIAQSGSTQAPWSYQSHPRDTFKKYADDMNMNCTADTTEESVQCLKNKTAEEIVSVCQKTVEMVCRTSAPAFPIIPSIETVTPKSNRVFLPDHPKRMWETGNFNYVPFIQGVCEDEGAFQSALVIQDDEFMYDLNYRWNQVGDMALGMDYRNISKSNLTKGLRTLRRFYFGDEDVSMKNFQNLTDMFSDAWFIASLDYTVRNHAKHAPMYVYVFSKKGAIGISDILAGKAMNRKVVSHGEDLQYMFFKGFASTKQDILFATRYIKLWVSFAYNGKPTETWGSVKSWPTVPPNTKDFPVMKLDDDLEVISNPWKDRAQAWHDLLENEWSEFQYQEGFSNTEY